MLTKYFIFAILAVGLIETASLENVSDPNDNASGVSDDLTGSGEGADQGEETRVVPQAAEPQDSPLSNETLREMGRDPAMMDNFDLSKFLCSTCGIIVGLSKRYIRHNKESTQGLTRFLQDQLYYGDVKDNCYREFDASGARFGKFFACETTLIKSLEEIQQKIEERGLKLLDESDELCYEKDLHMCKKSQIFVVFGIYGK